MLKEFSFKYLSKDLSAGLVVFLVALPLCLGVALASGAPLFSGIIAGMVGGVVAGFISGSSLGVSGPAAGLTVIVLTAITELGTYEVFLVAVVIGGIIQIILGFVGAGKIAYYFPSSVIKGMLAAIGIIIILKQIPHAFGIDQDHEGDSSFMQADGENTFSEFLKIADYFVPSALIIGMVCMVILLVWDTKWIKNNKFLSLIPGPLVVVVAGILINQAFAEGFRVTGEHLVSLPVASSLHEFGSFLTFPDFSNALVNPLVWKTAFVIAIIASIETLLCVEATDRLDPEKSITPTNRELFAQGGANIISGLIGGIPVTQVVVRSSANIQAGGKTKLATIFHGVLLFGCALLIPGVLNLIPLSALAAVLIMVGYKLTKPAIFKEVLKDGQDQFVPFVVTILAIVFTDLLTGIGIGLLVGLGYVIYANFKSSLSTIRDGKTILLKMNKDVFFYNRAELVKILSTVNEGDYLIIDGTKATFIDHDINLAIEDFVSQDCVAKGISVELKGIKRNNK